MQIGQAGGCAPLVSMLTSATALHSSVISFQMAVDHDEAQAHAATALAHLAALSSNQVRQDAVQQSEVYSDKTGHPRKLPAILTVSIAQDAEQSKELQAMIS